MKKQCLSTKKVMKKKKYKTMGKQLNAKKKKKNIFFSVNNGLTNLQTENIINMYEKICFSKMSMNKSKRKIKKNYILHFLFLSFFYANK